MEEILKIVGRNIRRKREHDGLTIAEAAERTTLSISEYTAIEEGTECPELGWTENEVKEVKEEIVNGTIKID